MRVWGNLLIEWVVRIGLWMGWNGMGGLWVFGACVKRGSRKREEGVFVEELARQGVLWEISL